MDKESIIQVCALGFLKDCGCSTSLDQTSTRNPSVFAGMSLYPYHLVFRCWSLATSKLLCLKLLHVLIVDSLSMFQLVTLLNCSGKLATEQLIRYITRIARLIIQMISWLLEL